MEHTLEFRQTETLLVEQTKISTTTRVKNQEAKEDMWEGSETNRYGVSLLMIGMSLMMGAIAAPYGVAMGKWQFALVLLPSVFTLLSSISLAPIKWIVGSGLVTTVVSAIVIIVGEMQGIS